MAISPCSHDTQQLGDRELHTDPSTAVTFPTAVYNYTVTCMFADKKRFSGPRVLGILRYHIWVRMVMAG